MRDSDFRRKLFWKCIDNLGSKLRSNAAKLAEPALNIPQHTQPTIPVSCVSCGIGQGCTSVRGSAECQQRARQAGA